MILPEELQNIGFLVDYLLFFKVVKDFGECFECKTAICVMLL